MCSEIVENLLRSIDESTEKRDPIDATYQISSSQPLIVEYKERRHLFIWSANALTLTLEDVGSLSVSANTWTNIGYTEGMRLTPVNQVSTMPVFVRATDETIP